MIDVIEEAVRECTSDKNKIRDDVKKKLVEHRSGFTSVKDVLQRDLDELIRTVDQVVSIRTFDDFVAVLVSLWLWHLSRLILVTAYHLGIVARRHFENRNFQITLNTVDHAYIDDQYLTCCLKTWIEEVESSLEENHEISVSDENCNQEKLEDLLESLESITNLKEIPEPHSELKYYKLMMENYHSIGNDREKTLIKKYKKICLELVIAHSDAFQIESCFLDAIVTFFRATKNTRDIIDKLQLEEFCSGELLLDELIDKILNLSSEDFDADVTGLQEAADRLKEKKNPSLTKTSRNLIKAFVKPVKIEKKTLDGRSVIEVTGKVIVLNDILDQLETLLTDNSEGNSDAEEVRFVGCDVMHVDRNLENVYWHGKNIVVLAKSIKIHDQVTWNVSGKDNGHIYHDNAGTDQDIGHGKQGADGFAGESGGNVLIVADDVSDPQNFVVISYGGRGSKGQNGGDGRHGEDGRGIDVNRFNEKFRSPVRVFDIGHERMHETYEYIKQLAKTTAVDWEQAPNTFIDVVTEEKKKITFSYASAAGTCRQAVLLCRGSSGQRGGDGGECGLGGQGGFNGEITSSNRNIIVRGVPGEDGESGEGGLYGDYGKNGWDMGYTDYQYWPTTMFHGEDERSKLRLKYHDVGWFSSPKSAVWCPYKCQYVEIASSRIEYKKGSQYQERRTRFNNELQHQALAIKKKSISQGKILADYSHCFTGVEGTMLQSSQSSFDNIIQRAVRALVENAQQQEKVITELRVKHLVESIPRDKNVRRGGRAPSKVSNVNYEDTANSQPDIQSLIREVTSTVAMDNCNVLRSTELTRCELSELFHHFDMQNSQVSGDQELSGKPDNDQLRIVKQLLIDKYRFAVLREIAQNEMLSGNYYDNTDNTIQSTAECSPRYLVVAEKNIVNVSHHILGTLNQYFYTDGVGPREKICKYCKEMSEEMLLDNDNEDIEPLKHSIRKFVLKAEKSNRVDPSVKKYYNEYKDFLKQQLHDLNIVFEPFRSELEKHKDIHDLWVQRDDDDSIRYEFNRRIQDHEVLEVLYRGFNEQLKQTYDWWKCWNDKNFVEAYYNDIRERGPLSEIYRELLAHAFEVNIKFYSQDQDNQFYLIDNHNLSAGQVIHILNSDDGLEELEIDENFLKLEKERAKSGNIYAQILAGTDSLGEKRELVKYFQTETYLRNEVLDNNASQQYSDENENLCEDETIREIIKYFSCPDERLRLKERLLKISSHYIGHNRILRYILKRFSNDGKHVSYQELCSLVNSILVSVADDRNDLNIFCWIVAAYSQENWTAELVLLQIENHLRDRIKDKFKWRDYLLKITDKKILMLFKSKLIEHKSDRSISSKFIEEVLRLLSSIPNELVNLDGIELSEWPCVMREKYWSHKLSPLADGQESAKLSGASYYLLTMENIYGTSLVTKFIESFIGKNPSPSPTVLINTLSNFCTEKWNLSDVEVQTLSTSSVTEWIEEMSKKFFVEQEDRDVTRLVEIIKDNENTSESVVDQLPVIESSIHSMRELEHTTSGETETSMTRLVRWVKSTGNYPEGTFGDSAGIEDEVRIICKNEQTTSGVSGYEIERLNFRTLYYRIIFRDHFKSYLEQASDGQFLDEARTDMLAAIDREVKETKGFKLRDTQKIAILALLTNERNTLAQVSTGEGKTLIVIVASIMKALQGEKVHIITSSSVLAKRDAAANRDIYGLFGIRVSHNCSEDIGERKAAYSGSQVVYGDLSSFQRDYLLDRFYRKNILGDSNFQNVFADEVDSMLLDKGKNMLYLSHDLTGLDKLESVYLYIWERVNRPARSLEDYATIFNVKAIHESVLDNLYSRLKKEDIQQIDPKLDVNQVKLIWDCLVDAGILDEEGRMLKEEILDNELETALLPNFSSYKNRLSFLFKERIGRVKYIHVPNYLKPFIEQHLESWINSAVTAVLIQAGHDYIMDVDRTGTSQDLSANVTIVDRDTGTDQTNSQWDEALHQFLQLKHGCKLSMQSLKAVFISNVSYLKLYSKLYGLTGTLGSRRERALLMEIHDVDFVTIPTAKSKQFLEEPPIICGNENEWIQEIYNESIDFTQRRGRSVLLICETINAAETLQKNFKDKGTEHVYIYTRDHEEFDIAQGTSELDQGRIIIATNLSGRGTDIRITKELKEAGGLHVCLTYLPNNNRIEEQAFGRAARSGDRGSGRLIILESNGKKHGITNIFDLKNNRDLEESHRVSVLKAYYETQIVTEELCFEKFQKQFGELTKILEKSNTDSKVTEILLQTCIDRWAFWLDKNVKSIKNVTNEESKKNLENRLDEFISQLKDLQYDSEKTDWLPWVETQPIQIIKIGKCFCRMVKYDQAIELFDKVIELEPNFSEAAHYYKGFALLKKLHSVGETSREQFLKNLKTELREAARLFDEHSRRSICAGSAIRANRKYHAQSNIVQMDTHAEQQKSIGNIYYMLSQSIHDIFDKPVTPESFFSADINEKLCEIIYADLHLYDILRKPKIKMSITEEALNDIGIDSGTSVGELKDYLYSLRGNEINEKELPKIFKNLKFPSREDFWKLSIELGILRQEVKCVIVDVSELEKIDPTLLELLRGDKELCRPTLKPDDANGIILHTEQSESQEDRIVLEKSSLHKVLTKNKRKYEFLKNKGVFSVNKKAIVDLSKISSSLPRYDAITLEDFTSANIPEDDACQILAELVEQNILTKVNSPDGIYRLGIPSDEIHLILLDSYPVYQSVVKNLLSRCFVYRITLDRIEKQLQRGDSAYPLLISHPHNKLIYELMYRRIIKPVTLKSEPHELVTKLRGRFNGTISLHDLEILFHQNGLIWDDSNEEKLGKDLLDKKWLSLYVPPTANKKDRFDQCVEEVWSCYGIRYTINDPNKRGELDPSFRSIEQKIKQIFDDRLQLVKKCTIGHIIQVLERSISPLKRLDDPDGSLNLLTQYNGLSDSRHIEEVAVFTLNGLDHILLLEERKWTTSMLINTGIAVAIGVCQIAVGAAMEVLSGGALSYPAASCVGEGIGDIIFAISSYRSGHFSWKSYGQHKIQSLMLTAATAGAGGYLAGGALLEGASVAVVTGRQLIKTVGLGKIAISVGRTVVSHTLRAAAIGLSYTGIDVLLQNFGNRVRDGMTSIFLSGITSKLEEHNIGAILKTMYRSLGKEKSMKIINDLTMSSLNEESLIAKYLLIVTKTLHTVQQLIKDGLKKVGQSGKNASNFVSKLLSYMMSALPWVGRAAYVVDIRNITGNLLNSLETKLKQALRTHESANPSSQNVSDQNHERVEDSEGFKKEVLERWNSLIHEKAGQIIEEHVVRPVLNEGVGSIVKQCEKMIEQKYRTYNVSQHNEFSEEEKREYQESKKKRKTSNIDAVHVDELAECEANEYNKIVNKLLAKTKNPELFADAIRENVPMDVTRLDACAKAVRGVLEIDGLTVIVKGEDGTKTKLTSSVKGVIKIHTVEIELIGNKFQLYGSDTSQSNRNRETKNNCFYEAVSQHIDLHLRMTRQTFALEVANRISQDKLKHRIEHSPFTSRVIKMSHSKLWKEIHFDERVKLPVQSTSAEYPCATSHTLKQPFKELTESRKSSWHYDEAFNEVKTLDGFLLLYNSRSVAAAIAQSDNHRLKIMAYEEIGVSRSEYNSWRKNCKDAVAIRVAKHGWDNLGIDIDAVRRRVKTLKKESYAAWVKDRIPNPFKKKGKKKKPNWKPENRSDESQVLDTSGRRNSNSTEDGRPIQPRRERFCTFCKRPGHTLEYCRNRKVQGQYSPRRSVSSESNHSRQGFDNRQQNPRYN